MGFAKNRHPLSNYLNDMRQRNLTPAKSPTWVIISGIVMVICIFGFILTLSGLI
jgi:ABC-type dipeptide/oligopeptide/nickel transport system permease subunit